MPRETVEHILRVASRAPSGVNTQPWRVYAIGGDTKARLCEELVDAHYNRAEQHQRELKLSPDRLPEPYKTRQREVAWQLFATVGIDSNTDIDTGQRTIVGKVLCQVAVLEFRVLVSIANENAVLPTV